MTSGTPLLEYDPENGEVTERQTVRVRVAVAVDSSGNYGIDLDSFSEAAEWLSRGMHSFYWIAADVPLPLPPQVIEGSVTPAEEGSE